MMTGILFYKIVRGLSDKHNFSLNNFFNNDLDMINIMYKNRIHMTNRTPINLTSTKTTGDGNKIV